MLKDKAKVFSMVAAILLIVNTIYDIVIDIMNIGGIFIADLIWLFIEYAISVVLAVALIKGKKNKTFIIAVAFNCISILIPCFYFSIGYIIQIIAVLLVLYMTIIHSLPDYEDKSAKTEKLFWLPAALLLAANIINSITYGGIGIFTFVYPVIYLCIGMWLVNSPICISAGETTSKKALTSILAPIIAFVAVVAICNGAQQTIISPDYGSGRFECSVCHNDFDGKNKDMRSITNTGMCVQCKENYDWATGN